MSLRVSFGIFHPFHSFSGGKSPPAVTWNLSRGRHVGHVTGVWSVTWGRSSFWRGQQDAKMTPQAAQNRARILSKEIQEAIGLALQKHKKHDVFWVSWIRATQVSTKIVTHVRVRMSTESCVALCARSERLPSASWCSGQALAGVPGRVQ